MLLVNDVSARHFGEGFYLKQVMDWETRQRLFKTLYNEKDVARFYKWEVIGSKKVVGYFDCFHWNPKDDPGRVDVDQGFIEKSLRDDVYDPFDGFAAVISRYSAWTSNNSTNSWTVPSDWNSTENFIDVIGGGGSGFIWCPDYNSDSSYGWGGSGGGFARLNNVSLTPGATVYNHVGASSDLNPSDQYGGTYNGGNSWFNITGTNGVPGSVAQGAYANGGGSAYFDGTNMKLRPAGTGIYGDVKYAGGNGASTGTRGTASGGGGAAGPYGAGKKGASGVTNSSGGGGGNGGGTAASGSSGGNNKDGYGGGAPVGGSGYSGGGGAGGGYFQSGGFGGWGGNGAEYNNGAWGSGGGAGGGDVVCGYPGLFGGGGGSVCNFSPVFIEPFGIQGLVMAGYNSLSKGMVMSGCSIMIA